jgi:hypothetical protein
MLILDERKRLEKIPQPGEFNDVFRGQDGGD